MSKPTVLAPKIENVTLESKTLSAQTVTNQEEKSNEHEVLPDESRKEDEGFMSVLEDNTQEALVLSGSQGGKYGKYLYEIIFIILIGSLVVFSFFIKQKEDHLEADESDDSIEKRGGRVRN